MKPIKSPFVVASVLVLGLLSACGSEEHQDIKQWMAESSRDLKGSVPPLPELKPFPVVSYDAANQPTPFDSSRIEPERKGKAGANEPDFDRPREQLESFPLESIDYIGVVSKIKTKGKHALVKVDGVVYQVTKGNYMGQNYGRIVSIDEAEIVLMETVQDPTGQTSDWVLRQMTLQLQEGAGSKESKK